MIRIYLVILLIGGGVAFTSCNGSQESIESESITHQIESDAIQLDNGEKWTVDLEMMAHIQSMQDGVRVSEEIGLDSLATQLKSDLDLLTSNCTMTGQAHDELHKWLLPFIQLVDQFDAAEGVDKKDSYQELTVSFDEFNQFFI